MFKYTCALTGVSRSAELNVDSCLLARYNGMSWYKIGTIGDHQSARERAARFGSDCNYRLLNEVRRSSEWEASVRLFADGIGISYETLHRFMLPKLKRSRSKNSSGRVSILSPFGSSWILDESGEAINLFYSTRIFRRETDGIHEVIAVLSGSAHVLFSSASVSDVNAFYSHVLSEVLLVDGYDNVLADESNAEEL